MTERINVPRCPCWCVADHHICIFIPFKERFLGGMSFANVVIICYPILLLNREGVKKRRGKKPYFFLLFLPLPSSWYSFYLHSIIWPLYDNSGSPTHPTVTFKSVGVHNLQLVLTSKFDQNFILKVRMFFAKSVIKMP